MSPAKPSLRRRLWKWFAATLAGVLILLAIGVGLFRVAVPLVPGLRADAEAMAERALGWPVHIGALDLQWAVFGPELVLTDVQLLAPDSDRPLVTAARLDIEFGPLDLFQRGALRPSHVRLHEPTLALERDAGGRLFLSGFALPQAGNTRAGWRELLELGLRHGRLTILDGELHYRDAVRGIDDWQLRLPELTLASDGERHELDARLLPPGALAADLSLQFTAEGRPDRPEGWRWRLGLEARELVLDEWYRQAGVAGAGRLRGEVDVAGRLSGTGLASLDGEGTVLARELRLEPTAPSVAPVGGDIPAAFARLGFSWRAAISPERRVFGIADLELEHGDLRHAGGAVSLRTPGTAYRHEVEAAALPLASLAGIANFLPSSDDAAGPFNELRDALRQLAPAGMIERLALGFDVSGPPRFSLRGRFRDLALDPWRGLPGFRGLSGEVEGSESSGRLQLDARAASFDFGRLFRNRLPVQQLRGSFRWQAVADGWRVAGDDIVVANPEATAEATLVLALPRAAPARIELLATARDVDLAARSTWLPAGVMSEPLVRWLDTAILAGRVPEARLVLRGPVGAFPFRDGSGTFDVRFALEDAVVDYAPGWPRVDGLQADVHFDGPGLAIGIRAARVMDLPVTGEAHFADLRDARLEVSAQLASGIEHAWAFLGASPLADNLAGVLGALEIAGPFQADVGLDIPLKDTASTRLQVDATLDGVDVHPRALPWTIEELRGGLRVTERELEAKQLDGRFTGAPLRAAIRPGEAAAGEFAPALVALQGRTPVQAFAEVLPANWLDRLDGAFDWHGELAVGGGRFDVHLDSPLAGVGSGLPAPLDRASAARVDIDLSAAAAIDASFALDGLAGGSLRFTDATSGWTFASGRVALGAHVPPGLPDADGLHIEGRTGLLDLGGWLAFEGAAAGGGGTAAASDGLLQGFDVLADMLRVGGVELAGQRLAGERMRQPAGWSLVLDGPATGRVSLPAVAVGREPWNVTLERLHLPGKDEPATAEGTESGESGPPDPRELPGLLLDIGDLRVGDLAFGKVSGELRRTAIGYTTQDLRAQASSFNLALDGRWEVVDGEHYTSISGALDSRDLGATLAALGYTAGLEADSGRIDANLAWHAAPLDMDYGLLEGTLAFTAEDGSLREVSPGAGRLIGLFSLAALPRRLLLDFSDFFGEGLHFDSLSGEFLLTDGNAYTTNVQLRGPSVSALLVGRTGLVARDYDQLAIVSPDVSASIPVAGYLAAGPNVGAALLLLSQLLKAPLTDITQVKYRITGSWDEPLIERVEQDHARRTPLEP